MATFDPAELAAHKLAYYNLATATMVPQLSKSINTLLRNALHSPAVTPSIPVDKSRVSASVFRAPILYTTGSRPLDASFPAPTELRGSVLQPRYFIKIPNGNTRFRFKSATLINSVDSEHRYSSEFGRVSGNGGGAYSNTRDEHLYLAIPLLPCIKVATSRIDSHMPIRCTITDSNVAYYANNLSSQCIREYPVFLNLLSATSMATRPDMKCVTLNVTPEVESALMELDNVYSLLDSLENLRTSVPVSSYIKALQNNPVYLPHHMDALAALENGGVDIPDVLLIDIVDYSLYSDLMLNRSFFFEQRQLDSHFFSNQQPRFNIRYL